MNVLDHKCPNCSAQLKFNPITQDWSCEFCENKFTLDELESKGKVEKRSLNLKEYVCNNCGAKLVTDENTVATSCVYCKNSAIILNNLVEEFLPSKIIPFKKTKEEAIIAFKELCKDKPLIPDEFSNEENIKEMTGIYIPFWLMDYTTNTYAEFNSYKADVLPYKEVRLAGGTPMYIGGGAVSDEKYKDYKTVYRINTESTKPIEKYLSKLSSNIEFKKIPIDGSKRFQDDIMNSIEPFEYNDLKDFNYSYLSGFFAEKYDVDEKIATQIAVKKVEATIINEMTEEIKQKGFFDAININKQVNVLDNRSEYILLPVWMLNIKFKGNIYTFAMNGQTGKIIGDIPIDETKKKKKFISTSVPPIAIIFIASLLFTIVTKSISIFFMIFPVLTLMTLLIVFTIVNGLVKKSKMIKFKKIVREYFVKGKVEITQISNEYIGTASFNEKLELSKRENQIK